MRHAPLDAIKLVIIMCCIKGERIIMINRYWKKFICFLGGHDWLWTECLDHRYGSLCLTCLRCNDKHHNA